MPIFRFMVLFMLLVSAGLFAAFALTGQPRYKRYGLLALKWTILAALGFFAGLALERLLASPG